MKAPLYPSYLDEERLPYPFCPGCGHGAVVDSLNAALVKLQLDPRQVVIVTDIGCAGLSDKFFNTNALHGLHGRSVTYATGIKLANPQLKVIVLIGDGGCGIGGNHLIHAARRNIGVTVLVFNNLNYGMTGGEQSATTPTGAATATTPYGNLERPMDICATVGVNGASYAARTTSFDHELPELIVQAILNDGFALIDIWELCTAHFVPHNHYSRKALEAELEKLGFSSGVVYRQERSEYGRAYREAVADQPGQASLTPRPLPAKYRHNLKTRLSCLMAGSAGQRIGTAARALCQGAILSGLWASQRNDYPVTVRSGYSLAEVVLSPKETGYPGIAKPDLLVILSHEGLAQVSAQLASQSKGDTLFIEASLLPVETQARVIPLELKGKEKQKDWSLSAIASVVEESGIYPLQALEAAVNISA